MNCRFIETQRLLRVGVARGIPDDDDYIRPVVTELAAELKAAIKNKLAEYGVIAQSLESTYPKRLISKALERLPEAELRRRLDQLDEERAKFMEVGLLDKEEALQISSKGISDDIIDALSIYVADTATKLQVFRELFEKIQVFRRVINKRLQYKSLSIDKDAGFTIKRFDGVTLSLTGLSSGEQHELVLMYELLFSVEAKSLILIDEPELSLHVAWQSEFLADIFDVISLRKFDVVIATHSPQIINDRWDLVKELRGPPT
jgi:predicted ATP-dependent endonuclease of OLD family